MRLCTKCKAEKPTDAYYRRASAKSGFMSECKNCHDAWQRNNYTKKREVVRRHTKKLRGLAIDALGGKCLHCGHEDRRVFQIDHIHGGGRAEKRLIGDCAIHRKIIAGDTVPYQLLCANCHVIKTWHTDAGSPNIRRFSDDDGRSAPFDGPSSKEQS